MMMHVASQQKQRGALMIEVLITIAIIVFGLWGLLEMQSRLQKSEVESYQRTQALILLNDMASRISTNRSDTLNYVTTGLTPAYLGTGITCPAAGTTLQTQDTREWCLALQGAAEVQAGGNVGAMIGARGCVEEITADQYMVTVVWQGLTPISAPPTSVTCGDGLYNVPAGSGCVDNLCRRHVTSIVRLANLETL
jgi:type IV pilus assembly protein PilV